MHKVPFAAQGRVKIGDFGLARVTRAPLRPLSDNGVVVTIWCSVGNRTTPASSCAALADACGACHH